MKKKNFYPILIVVVFIVVLVTIWLLFTSNNNANTPRDIMQNIEENKRQEESSDVELSEKLNSTVEYDKDEEVEDYTTATNIVFKNNIVEVSGEGVTTSGTKVTITKAGNYNVSGTVTDGTVVVDAEKTDVIKIMLDNANITSSNTSPIYVKKAEKVIVTLKSETTNKLTDGSNYVYDDVEEEEPKATIYSKSDLVINGNGKLEISSNFNDAISSNDGLRILNGNISIESIDDGIRGKDYVYIKNGNITLDTQGDAIKSTNTDSDDVGFCIIENGNLDIKSGTDGIDAESSLYIKSGNFNLITGGGSAVSSKTSSNWGNLEPPMNDRNKMTTEEENTSSAKALKATNVIQIDNGNFVIDSSDDSIHSNNNLYINNGTFEISSGDDGIHSDTKLDINGGKINITKSYEGIESQNITITSGEIKVVASDDGINAAGANDMPAMVGRPGQNNFNMNSNSSNILTIDGGTLVVNAEGDGIDSNGNIFLNGGKVTVYGPTIGGNGILDYDGEFKITSGELIATGTSDMIQSPSNESTQYSLVITLSSFTNSGTDIIIKNKSGEEVIKTTPNKDYAAIIISSSKLEKGETYTIYVGGTEIDTVTISNVTTTVGNSGGMMNKKMGR